MAADLKVFLDQLSEWSRVWAEERLNDPAFIAEWGRVFSRNNLSTGSEARAIKLRGDTNAI